MKRLSLFSLALFAVLGLTGCDTFSNVTVNCQVGMRDDNTHVAACQFKNTGKQAAEGCVIVHLEREKEDDDDKLPTEFVAEKICSGQIAPGKETGAFNLTFEDHDAEAVARACTKSEGDKHNFICEIKLKEVKP